MTEQKRKSIPEQLNAAANVIAERTHHPWRQIKEAVGVDEAERWTIAQVQFTEDARMAARRALWFLRLAEVDSDAALLRHARENALDQVRFITIPDPDECCGEEERSARCEYSGAIEPKFATLVEKWKAIVASLQQRATPAAPRQAYDHLRAVESQIVWFIRRSRPLNPFIRFTYSFAPAAGSFVKQHFAIIATFFIGLAVCAGVEAVRSILLNAPRFTTFAIAVALAPLVALYAVQRGMHARGRAAPWNIGGRVVHSLPVSVEPPRWRPWHPDGYATRIYMSLALKTALHAVLWIVVGLIVRTGVQALGWDEVRLTVYLIVMLWALTVLLGGIIDFADMHSRSPLRFMMLGGVVVMLVAIMLTDSAPAAQLVIGSWVALMVWWTLRVRNRPALGIPVVLGVFATVAIGMTDARQRDDIWLPSATAGDSTVQLNQWPMGDRSSGPVVVLAASGGGSRAAIFTARTLSALEHDFPAVAANLQAISSVSGGSLANAAYVARKLRPDRAVIDASCGDSLSSAVSRDFIQPTIMGLWKPGGRGRAIERAWERCPVGLSELTIDTLARRWREASARRDARPPFPIPLFNSTTLERNAVVISPLDYKFFKLPFDDEARDTSTNKYRQLDSPTWVFYRSGIYHLSDLTGGMSAPLSKAVRASANFPFGFPLVEVQARNLMWYSTSMSDKAMPDTATRMVRLTDGGALSNSGMWPLVPLLRNQREQIGDNRGVLMIVVDASRMPGAPWTDRQRGLVGTLVDKNPKGERLHMQMLQQLRGDYGQCFEYVYIGIEPKPEYNVYTTWALDEVSRHTVDVAFDAAWRAAAPEMKAAYDRLQKCENGGDDARRRDSWRPGRVPLS